MAEMVWELTLKCKENLGVFQSNSVVLFQAVLDTVQLNFPQAEVFTKSIELSKSLLSSNRKNDE